MVSSRNLDDNFLLCIGVISDILIEPEVFVWLLRQRDLYAGNDYIYTSDYWTEHSHGFDFYDKEAEDEGVKTVFRLYFKNEKQMQKVYKILKPQVKIRIGGARMEVSQNAYKYEP